MININSVLDEITNNKSPPLTLISKVIAHIGTEVIYNNETVKLSWSHIEDYLKHYKDKLDSLYNNFIAYVWLYFCKHARITEEKERNIVQFVFDDDRRAESFTDLLDQVLPLIGEEYPKMCDSTVLLTSDQLYFCSLYGMQIKEKVSVVTIGNHYYLKTLRADSFDFSHAFILGIIPGEKGRRLQNLRPADRGKYVVTSDQRVVSRFNKRSRHSEGKKKNYSQIQSVTLIDKDCMTKAFGFNHGRDKKLYGLLTHNKDLLINRLLPVDSGTYHRVFEFENIGDANRSAVKDKKNCYPSREIESFKTKIREKKHKDRRPNEVMARLRFNPYRSIVCISSDTLEARLLAVKFAEELLEEFKQYATRKGLAVNKKFSISIIFYIPPKQNKSVKSSEMNLLFYTSDMLVSDRAEASRIFNSPEESQQKYQNNDYEFLLGLSDISPSLFLTEVGAGVPLALHMLRQGYARTLMRALGKLGDEVFDLLLDRNLIKENDSVISELVFIEEFHLANKLLNRTGSSKDKLRYRNWSMKWYLIYYGNPRQINFYGMESVLTSAAYSNRWITIMLYLKEYPNIDQYRLSKILYESCSYGRHKETSILLKMSAHSSLGYLSTKPIRRAADSEDWGMVTLFADYETDVQDNAEYGYAVLQAICKRQLGVAKLLLKKGAKPLGFSFGNLFNSTLYYGVLHGYDNIGELIEYELKAYSKELLLVSKTTCPFNFYPASCLALDQAELLGDQKAIDLLKEYVADLIINEHENRIIKVARLFIEALALENEKLAEYRLLKYLHHFSLLDKNNNNFIDGLGIIFEKLNLISRFVPERFIISVFVTLFKMLIERKDAVHVNLLFNLRLKSDEFKVNGDYSAESYVFKGFVKNLTPDTAAFITKVVRDFTGVQYKYKWIGGLFCELVVAVNEKINAENRNRAIFLMHYYAQYCEKEAHSSDIVIKAIKNRYYEVAALLVQTLHFEDKSLNSILIAAIKASDSKTVGFVIKKIVKVTVDHIKLAADMNDEIILECLLKAFGKNYELNIAYRNAFYSAWRLGCYKNNLTGQLTRLLDPTLIRHLVLIHVAALIENSMPNKELIVNGKMLTHLQKMLSDASLHTTKPKSLREITAPSRYKEVLWILEYYFSSQECMPHKSVVDKTFQEVLSCFDKASLSRRGFFKGYRLRFSFGSDIYFYLNKVDQLLSKKETKYYKEPEVEPVNYKQLFSGVVF